jgi:hypothetical protein
MDASGDPILAERILDTMLAELVGFELDAG